VGVRGPSPERGIRPTCPENEWMPRRQEPAEHRRVISAVADAMVALLESAVRAGSTNRTAARSLEGDPLDVQNGLRALVLRTLFASCLRERGSIGAVAWLSETIDLVPGWARASGATSPLLVDPNLPLCAGPDLPAWLELGAAERLFEAVADDRETPGTIRARDAGAVYQELLELRVRRVGAPSLCVKPRRIWVSARDVLAQDRNLRAKWLMAEAALPKGDVGRLGPALAAADSEDAVFEALERWRAPGTHTLPASSLAIESAVDRRRSGSHFTPRALCRAVLGRALGPLLVDEAKSADLLRLKICDPSMGSGAFLVECAELLAEKVAVAWRLEGRLGEHGDAESKRHALSAVVSSCLYGVDKDPIAVDLARCSITGRSASPSGPPLNLSGRLVSGDALIGSVTPADDQGMSFALAMLGGDGAARFDWHRAFPEVFDVEEPGFDVCVGNPPWVAYAGRAAQPLDDDLFRFYFRMNPAFAGYRTLHGLFVRRAAELLRDGGRLGFVVPTSVADLDGYDPTRRAHDALAEVDDDLLDFGDGAFEGVFQPCMALTSTRRRQPAERREQSVWPLARSDLDETARRLLERLTSQPKLDPALFGERGFQTTGPDLAHIRRLDAPEPPFVEPIREGSDVREFEVSAPRCFLDPVGLTGRFRPKSDWLGVGVLIRQTARYPIAALADGVAFRNSILAGFGSDEWTPAGLAAYLNSSAVRFFHYACHRDARQGMPQLKIGHLRALPAVRDSGARAALDALGRKLGAENAGIGAAARHDLETLVFDALDFRPDERALVMAWASENPLPKRRLGIRSPAEPLP
jgi:hypothetical protein